MSCRNASIRCSPSCTSIFNEGYAATEGESLVRADLCDEAIRLASVLAMLMPSEPEALGLPRG